MIKKFVDFIKEVKLEMKKVSWPGRKEVTASTSAVLITTVILGFFLGIVDFTLSKGIGPILAGTPTAVSWITLAVFGAIMAWIYKIIQS